jgi:hypothetical protein
MGGPTIGVAGRVKEDLEDAVVLLLLLKEEMVCRFRAPL